MESVFLLLTAVAAASSDTATLVGRITAADGTPVADARVDIWTARPKVGIGTL